MSTVPNDSPQPESSRTDDGPASRRSPTYPSWNKAPVAPPSGSTSDAQFVSTNRNASLLESGEDRYGLQEGSLGSMRALSQLTILVVEDDPDARELMQAVLEQHGAQVSAADSVARALELLEGLRPDLIISDIAMPDEDGIAFVKKLRLRSAEAGGRTPAIAVSAFAAASDRLRALAAGFTHYLHKPVDFQKLSAAIRDCTQDSGENA